MFPAGFEPALPFGAGTSRRHVCQFHHENISGAPGGTLTLGPRIKGPLLFQLSYERMIASESADATVGAAGGIRTHGSFTFAGFQDRSHQPLGHRRILYYLYKFVRTETSLLPFSAGSNWGMHAKTPTQRIHCGCCVGVCLYVQRNRRPVIPPA